MNSKSFWLLFSIAALLRLAFIWIPPLWYDENFSLIVARLPWSQFWQAILGDVHPPLYYLIIRPIAQLTTIPWLIRLPSVIFSLAALWLFWRILLCWSSIPDRIQSAALILMVISPVQLWFAQEARMYALFEMLVLLSFYAFQREQWKLLTVANILLIYTQNYALFYLAIFALLIVLSWRWQGLPAIIVPIAAWFPWIFVLQNQMHNIAGRYWISAVFSSPASVLNVFPQLFFGPSIPDQLAVFGWILLFVLLILGVYTVTTVRPLHWLSYLLMGFGPLALAVIASLIWQPVILYRPLLASTPFLYIVICWPLIQLDLKSQQLRKELYLAVFTAPVLIASLIGYYIFTPADKGVNINKALAYVRANWQPGDVIIHTGDGSLVNLLPYAPDLPQLRAVDCESAIGSLSDQTRKALRVKQIDLSQISGRAWVFAQETPLDPSCLSNELGPVTKGVPAFVIDDNDYIYSGVWLEGK